MEPHGTKTASKQAATAASPHTKLLPFFALTHGVAWLFFFGAALAGGLETGPGSMLFSLSALGLLLAGPVLAWLTYDRAELADYWRRLVDVRRIGGRWYLAIFLIPPLLVVAGATLSFAVTVDPDELRGVLRLPLPLGVAFVTLLFGVVIAPLVEEMAWRGYALPELQKRYTALASSLFLGLLWAIWHLPLFFIPGSYQYELGLFTVAFWQFVFVLVPGSIVMTWIFNNTGRSTLSAVLYHAMWNLAGMSFETSVLADVFYAVVLLGLAALLVLRFGAKTLTNDHSRDRENSDELPG